MNTSRLFSDKSDLYASSRPQYPGALFEWVASQSPRDETVWDCATGNGQGAIGLVDFFDHVEATDISEAQLAHAFPHPKIRYSQQPAEKTNFEDNYFDTIHVAQALHWFNYTTFWPEVMRILKPGGFFVAHTYGMASVNAEIDAFINENLLQTLAPYWSAKNQLALDGYATISFPLTRVVSPDIAFELSWDLTQFFNFMHTWSATRLLMKEIGEDFFLEAYEKTKTLWGDPDLKRTTSFPFKIIAGYNERP